MKQWFILYKIVTEFPKQSGSRFFRIDISPVTIYSWIKREKSEGGRLYKFLRQSNRKRRRRYGIQEKRGQIPDRRSIEKRPKVVNERRRIGDWESDTVVDKSRGINVPKPDVVKTFRENCSWRYQKALYSLITA